MKKDNADYRRSKETDGAETKALLQDLPQMRKQKPDHGHSLQKMQVRSSKTQEQGPRSQEVSSDGLPYTLLSGVFGVVSRWAPELLGRVVQLV